MNDYSIVTIIDPIKEKYAVEERQWKHYLMENEFGQKKNLGSN